MRRLLLALTLVVGITLGGTAQPESADAWAYAVRRGRPGNVWVPTATFIGHRQGTEWWCCWYVWPNTDAMLTVGRAPVRGRQLVSVAYVLQRVEPGGWQTQQSRVYHAVIKRGQKRIRFRQPGFNYLNVETPTGFYRMVYLVSWVNRRTGRTIGSVRIDPSTTSDHWCGAQLRCTFSTGWVNIRGFVTD